MCELPPGSAGAGDYSYARMAVFEIAYYIGSTGAGHIIRISSKS